jgi:hypothetical protein
MVRTEIQAAVAEELKQLVDGVAKHFLARTYGPDGMPWGTKFSDLESLSVEIGKAISQSIMEQALTRQANDVPADAEVCPGCGQAVPPKPNTRSETRTVSTTAGTVNWSEPERYCPRCRAAFFPSGPRVGD